MSSCLFPRSTGVIDFPKPILRLIAPQLQELLPEPPVFYEAHLIDAANCEEVGYSADGFRCEDGSGQDEVRDRDPSVFQEVVDQDALEDAGWEIADATAELSRAGRRGKGPERRCAGGHHSGAGWR